MNGADYIPRPDHGAVWLTGASAGIGKAVTARLVEDGWTVYITARSEDKLVAMAEGSGGKIIPAPGDVTDPEAMEKIVARIEAGHGLALAILHDQSPRWEDLWIATGCAIGAWLMRGAGCTWNDITNDAQRYYSLSGGNDPNLASADLRMVFEEKSRQPMHIPAFQRLGSAIHPSPRQFQFEVDAHMVVHGQTDPKASVSVGGDPVHVEADGTFALKMDLPDRRQVLPVIASSRDGTEQRTTVLAIERNTKVMEPLTRGIDEVE